MTAVGVAHAAHACRAGSRLALPVAVERQQEEKKTERDIAIEKANEIMERVVLEGGGECDWAGCREALGAVYEEGGLGFFAKVVRG